MSVQVRRRRESAAFLQTFVGAQGELLVDTTNNRVQVHDGTTRGGWPAAAIGDLPGRNALINGTFAVNQRAYGSGTALPAGGYAHDRWKAGSGGCTYGFSQVTPDTTVGITAGSLVQVVESAAAIAAAAWLSWTGTAVARVYAGAAASQGSPAYAAGTATTVAGIAVNALAIAGLTPGTALSVEFAGGTLGLVQLEAALPGAGPTRFERRVLAQEIPLCQRFFQRWAPPPLRGIASSATYLSRMGMVLPVPMRAAPSASMNGALSCYNGTNGGKCSGLAASYCSPTTMELDLNIPSSLNMAAGQFVLVYQNYDGASVDLTAEL